MEYVSLTEEAERVGMPRRKAQRLATANLIEVVRLGRFRGVKPGALDAFVGIDRRFSGTPKAKDKRQGGEE